MNDPATRVSLVPNANLPKAPFFAHFDVNVSLSQYSAVTNV